MPLVLLMLWIAPPDPVPATAVSPAASPEYVEIVEVVAPPQPEPEPEPELEPEPEPAPDPDAPPASADATPPIPPPSTASADDEPAPTWQAEIFVDVAYGFNSNWPDNHVYRGMVTSPRTQELAVNAVGGFIRHRASEREPWWFELGLHAGAAVDALTANEPIAGGPDGKFAGAEVFKHIALANVGLRIRKSKTSLGAGVFEGPLGIGSFWTANNSNFTTSWESNLVPYYMTGAKIVQELPGNVEIAGWFVNGFQTYSDVNAVPSGIVTLTWARPPRTPAAPRSGERNLTLASNVYFGPESVNLAPQDWLVYWDSSASWDVGDRFSLAGVWDLGVNRPGRDRALQGLYTGGALFLRGTVLERDHARIDLALRPEASWDRDGTFYGVPQWLASGTFTANLRLWDHLLLRAEYRYDRSTAADGFFYRHEFGRDDAPGLARDQHTVFLAMSGWWDFWFGRRSRD